MTIESAIAGVGLLDVATFGILNAIVTDVLVRRLFFSAHRVWELIGKPVGPLWTPPGTTVKDTFAIYERRVSISQMLKRASALPDADEAVAMIQTYHRIHRMVLVMIVIGLLCFCAGLVMSFL